MKLDWESDRSRCYSSPVSPQPSTAGTCSGASTAIPAGTVASRIRTHKFYLSDLDNRVQVLAVEDVDRVSPNADLGFLILDEAHHIAAMATSSDAVQRRRFETCKHLAHKSDRLLLLSATPVLNHEQDFLAMLHLLDPGTYQLDDLEGFRARVKNRQQIGRVLLSFKEGANPFVLKTNLNQLRKSFCGRSVSAKPRR